MMIKKIQIIGATFICLYLSIGLAYGTTYTWIKAGDGNWGDTNNWSPSGYPQAGDTAKFDNNTGRTITLETNHSVDTVEVTKGAWTWSGNSLSVGTIFDYKSDVNNLSALNSTLTGTGSLRVAPTRADGQLNVNGDNSFSGGTVLESGWLTVNHSNALGTAALTVKGTAACLNQTVANNTTVTITNAIILDGDIVNVSPRGGHNNTTVKTTGTVTLTGNRIINISADGNGSRGALEFAGLITDGGNGYTLTRQNTGKLILSGTMAFGDLIIHNGRVDLPNDNAAYAGNIRLLAGRDIANFFSNNPGSPSIYVDADKSLGTGVFEWEGTWVDYKAPFLYGRMATLQRISGKDVELANQVTMRGYLGNNAGPYGNYTVRFTTPSPTLSGPVIFDVYSDGNGDRSLTFTGGLTDSGKQFSLSKYSKGTLYLLGNNTFGGPLTLFRGDIRLIGDNSGLTGAKTIFDGTLIAVARNGGSIVGPLPVNLSDSNARMKLEATTDAANTAIPAVVFKDSEPVLWINGVASGTEWAADALTRSGRAMLRVSGGATAAQLTSNDKLKISGWSAPATGMIAPWFREQSGHFLTYDPTGIGIKRATHLGGDINTRLAGDIFLSAAAQTLSANREVLACMALHNFSGSYDLTIGSGGLTLKGAVTMANNLQFNDAEATIWNDASATISGAIIGNNGLTKAGDGTLTLSGNNSSLDGGVTVLKGKIKLSGANALPGNKPLTLHGIGGLELDGNNFAPAVLTMSGGEIINSSATTATLTLPAKVVYNGGYNRATIWPASTRTLNVTLSSTPTTFDIADGASGLDMAIGLSENSRYVVMSGNPTTVTKKGGGVLRFGGNNTFTGNVVVENGALEGIVVSVGCQPFGDSNNAIYLKRNGILTFTGGNSTTIGAVEFSGANALKVSVGTGTLTVYASSLTRKAGSRATLQMMGDYTAGTYFDFWADSRKFTVAAWASPNPQPNTNRIMAPWCVMTRRSPDMTKATFSYVNANGVVLPLGGVGGNIYNYHRATLSGAGVGNVIDLAAAEGIATDLEIYALHTSFDIIANGNPTLTLGSGGLIADADLTIEPKLKFGSNGDQEALIHVGGYRAYRRVATFADAVTTSGGLTKFGEGTLELAADNSATLSGAHWVNEGVLRLANGNALKSDATVNIERNAAVEIADDYTLAHNFKGLGSITTGDNTLTLTGSLTPGFSIGTLAVEKLNFQGTLNWEYNDDVTDLVECKSLTLGGSKTVNVSWIGTGEAKTGTFPLFSYKGNDPTLGSWTVNAPAGLVGYVSIDSSAKQVVLELSAAPKGILILIR